MIAQVVLQLAEFLSDYLDFRRPGMNLQSLPTFPYLTSPAPIPNKASGPHDIYFIRPS